MLIEIRKNPQKGNKTLSLSQYIIVLRGWDPPPGIIYIISFVSSRWRNLQYGFLSTKKNPLKISPQKKIFDTVLTLKNSTLIIIIKHPWFVFCIILRVGYQQACVHDAPNCTIIAEREREANEKLLHGLPNRKHTKRAGAECTGPAADHGLYFIYVLHIVRMRLVRLLPFFVFIFSFFLRSILWTTDVFK